MHTFHVTPESKATHRRTADGALGILTAHPAGVASTLPVQPGDFAMLPAETFRQTIAAGCLVGGNVFSLTEEALKDWQNLASHIERKIAAQEWTAETELFMMDQAGTRHTLSAAQCLANTRAIGDAAFAARAVLAAAQGA